MLFPDLVRNMTIPGEKCEPAPRRLLVFGRVPGPGRVKTRLIPVLEAEGAAALYQRLLYDTLTTAAGMADVRVEFWCDATDEEWPRGRELADHFGVSAHRQHGTDLGARMYHALAAEPTTPCRPAVLIGSDCPGYDRTFLNRAFRVLADKDAVLGPALDGGYVLIGVKRVDTRLFADIPWSTGAVLGLTRARLRELGWSWRELAPLRDIDCPEDLVDFPNLLQRLES